VGCMISTDFYEGIRRASLQVGGWSTGLSVWLSGWHSFMLHVCCGGAACGCAASPQRLSPASPFCIHPAICTLHSSMHSSSHSNNTCCWLAGWLALPAAGPGVHPGAAAAAGGAGGAGQAQRGAAAQVECWAGCWGGREGAGSWGGCWGLGFKSWRRPAAHSVQPAAGQRAGMVNWKVACMHACKAAPRISAALPPTPLPPSFKIPFSPLLPCPAASCPTSLCWSASPRCLAALP
jgi:hypothetical protein